MINIVVMICALLLGLVIGVVVGVAAGEHKERKAAVQNNCAHWSIDSITGEKIFVYGSK